MTHGYVRVVPAQKDLLTLSDHLAVEYSGVDRGLGAAGTDGFNLGYGVCYFQQPETAGEYVGLEVGSEAEAHDGDAFFVNQPSEAVYLLGGKELAFVGDDHIAVNSAVEKLPYVGFWRDDRGHLGKPNAGTYDVDVVTGVGGGLYEPHLHAHFFIVEFCN